MPNYLAPGVLVDSDWVGRHLQDANVRILECDSDPTLYDTGHLPGAVRLDTQTELQDMRTRDLIGLDAFEALAGRLGIGNDTEVVLYGDQNNIQACFAYWVFRSFGHDRLRIIDGGRSKLLLEGRAFTRELPKVPRRTYRATGARDRFRAMRDDVLRLIGGPGVRHRHPRVNGHALIDDRSRDEFEGVFAPNSAYTQRFLRAGHIPGAANLPFRNLLQQDGTFRSIDEIIRLLAAKGISPDADVVVYTRIGERAALMWFVLHELVGFTRVRVYDGSWTEWGNTVGMPIESGAVLPVPTRPTMGPVAHA